MLILLLLTSSLFINIPCIFANSEVTTTRSEIVMMVNSANAQSLNDNPSEYKFITNYLRSTYIQNLQDDELNLMIPKNMLGWSYVNYSLYNITMFDNLGNIFEPIIETYKVQNPEIEVVLPSNFEYCITISCFSNYNVFFDSEKLEYMCPFNSPYLNSVSLTMKFPKDYTILHYSTGGKLEQENEFIVITFPENENLDINTRFLPFSLHGSITSFKATTDLPMVFPNIGEISGIIEESIVLPMEFGIWNINPLLIIDIPFPDYAQNLSVEKVTDSEGECNEISKPLQKLDSNSCGLYFVDFENRAVKVYPRYSYGSDFYPYEISVTFVMPSGNKLYNLEAIRKMMLPYRYGAGFIIDRVTQTNNWSLNLTGNLEIKFILPEGTDPIPSESGNPTIGTENGRPTASYVYTH